MTRAERRADTQARVRLLDSYAGRLWLLAALLYLCGDTLTTVVGLGWTPLREVGPLSRPLLDRFGLGHLVGLKLIVFCGFVALWHTLPRPIRVGVPLGLVIAGGGVTIWNAVLIVLVAA